MPAGARLSHLVDLPEGENLGKAIDDAMKLIEGSNPELRDVLPRGYQRLEKSTLSELPRGSSTASSPTVDSGGDEER